ncbi:NAD(P)/FAD-dependent oxidoreductase [Luteolibacter sp. AS25]|uniref:NAD(P)/FAD-dependent oxidoreductase n=1 Tax=Luteolibacter sp. AS25 TaxID=3135776 RepID=UPI00398B4F78
MSEKPSIAIIGTGISGLACAHFLQRDYELTLFEKDNRIGGHSHTVTVPEDGNNLPLDTGFMVYNEVTYPHLTRLFKELAVETKPTAMSFSVQHLGDGIEFNGGSLNLLFSQRKNLLSPRFWKMLLQINRFNKETIDELANPAFGDLSLVEYVEKRGYGADMLQWYLSPMAAAVWSSPPERIQNFPARTLMRFWHNHGFLGLDTQHPWRTVSGGSREYVKKVTAPFADRIIKNNPVRAVLEKRLILNDGSSHSFDKIILASHADQSLSLLASPTSLEHSILENFHYQPNTAVVHTDPKFMPRTERAWASWNYRISQQGNHSTHYWMNSLQGVSEKTNYFVSINPPEEIPEEKVLHTLQYEHPIFDSPAIAAQSRIGELHTAGHRTGHYYCGAWQANGFHEDGIRSAHTLCWEILNRDPWE